MQEATVIKKVDDQNLWYVAFQDRMISPYWGGRNAEVVARAFADGFNAANSGIARLQQELKEAGEENERLELSHEHEISTL